MAFSRVFSTSKIEQQIEHWTSSFKFSTTEFLSELSISASNPILLLILTSSQHGYDMVSEFT